MSGWISLLPANGLEGLDVNGPWDRVLDRLTIANLQGGSSITFGADDWRDYEIEVGVTPKAMGNVQILFRMSPDGSKRYLVDFLMGWRALAVSKFNKGLLKLSVVDYDLAPDREYALRIAVRGASVTTYIDGRLLNQVTDTEITNGRFALTVWQSAAEFREPRVRRLD